MIPRDRLAPQEKRSPRQLTEPSAGRFKITTSRRQISQYVARGESCARLFGNYCVEQLRRQEAVC